ncbi:hypothetical protein BsWGS_08264 [Bradybaena similaris]
MAMLRYPLAQFAAASCLLVFLSPLTAAYGVQTGADDTETETWLESLIKLYQPASTDVGQQQTHYFTQEQIDYFKTLLNKRKAGTVNDDLKQEIVDHFFPKDSEENTTQEEPQTTTPADDSEEQVIQEQQTTTPVDDSEEDTTQQEQQTTTPADDSEEQVTQEQQTTKPADDSEEDTTQQEQQTTTPAESEEQSKQDSEEDTTQQVQQTTTPAESDEQSKQDSEEDTTQQEQQTTTPADDSEENTTQQEQYTAIPVDDSEEQTTQQEQQTTTPAEDSEEQTTKQEIQTTTPADDSEEQTTKQEIQTTTPADDSEEHTTQQEQQTTTPADDSEEDTTQEQQTTPADSDEQSKEDSEDTDDDDDDSHEKTTAPVIATTTVTPAESTTTVTPIESTTTVTPIESTTTVTPIESTTRVQPSLELCNNCVVHHGVGYAPIAGYCDAYIQCRFYGALPTSVDIRRCPAGNFWNQDKLTCDFEANVKCTPVNGCPNHKAIPGDWAAYLINNGQNWTRVSCPEGRLYNSVTCGCTDKHGGDDKTQENCYDKKAILDDKTGYMQFTGNGWVRMACPATVGYNELTCRCTDTLATQASSNCPNMKPIPGDRSGFLQFTGVSWIPRSCAATLVYNPDLCICTYDTTNAVDNDDGNSNRRLCKSTLILNFDNNDATDSSTNKFWVNNTGVTFTDGKAYFNGKSRLTIPGLSNVEFGSTVYISIKYRHSSASSKQTLVANGDCQVRQSLAVCSGKDSVDFYAETKDQISVGKVTVPSDIGVWQGAVYALDNGNLVGSVGSKTIVQPVKGALDRRQRGLVIGGGGDCDNFHGIIDEVQVFLCKPEL